MSEKNIYAQILDAIAEGESVSMNTEIKGDSGKIAEGLTRSLKIVEPDASGEGLSVVKPEAVKTGDDFEISEPMLPKERLIVLGGGHIALPVCEFASKCGFEVYVVDDRPGICQCPQIPVGGRCDLRFF